MAEKRKAAAKAGAAKTGAAKTGAAKTGAAKTKAAAAKAAPKTAEAAPDKAAAAKAASTENRSGASASDASAAAAGPAAAIGAFGAAFGADKMFGADSAFAGALPEAAVAGAQMTPEDWAAFAANIGEAVAKAQDAWSRTIAAGAAGGQGGADAVWDPQAVFNPEAWRAAAAGGAAPMASPTGAAAAADPFNAFGAFASLWQSMLTNPADMAERTMKFWSDQGEIWRRAAMRAGGAEVDPVAEPARGDKRFKDPEWSQNLVFDALKQSYLLTSAYLTDAAANAGDLDQFDRRKVAFFTRQFVEALSPSNYFALNPEVLRATFEERGENLVRGLNHVVEDIERGGGQLLIKQTDATKFKVGENMAVTPGKVIFRNEVMELIQYAPMTEQVERRPVLICPPWINKYYILDLNPKKSLVKWLLEQGHTVFMISWVNPDARHRDKEFVDYIAEGLFEAVVRVLDECEAEDLHLASYCIGGTMTATALAYLAQQEDHPLRGRIASATFFTAQFEFTDAGELQLFVDDPQLRHLESQMPDGYLPAEKMAGAFNMLRASDLIWSYVISNYMLGRDPFPFDLLTWNSDSTNMPGKVHTYYLEKFYRDNALADGALQLGHSVLDLASVDLPTYHVATREDHIAPAASVYRGVQAIGGDKRFVLAGSGHIAGVVNPPAGGKYQFWARDDGAMPEGGVEAWFEGAEESPGSWWGDWDGWMKALNGAAEKVPGRQPGRRHNALADAPGEYVRIPFTAARERGRAAGEADAAE